MSKEYLFQEFNYDQISELSNRSLETLRVEAENLIASGRSKRDPFNSIRSTDHLTTFTPPTGLFYYPDPRWGETYGAFSGWAQLGGIELDNKNWQGVEAAYQAAKFPHDGMIQEAIRLADHPRIAKKIGHAYPMRPDWEEVCDIAMLRPVLATIQQHPHVQELLQLTNGAVLVEDAPRDAIWGRGPDFDGQNKLGRVWMLARNIVQAGDPEEVIEETYPIIFPNPK